MKKIIEIFKKIILKPVCVEDKHDWIIDNSHNLHIIRKCNKCKEKQYYNSYYTKWKKMF